MRSRDTEKTIRELQQFLREHEDEITDEDSMHRLAITFMSQHNSRLQPKQTEPEDASDYLELAEAASSKKKRLEYTGALEILKVILSYDYLWINLRVKGGAYGCMSGFKRNGESYLVSYRDPHLKRTLDVYKGIPDYIRNFQADERDMTKYVIGTISGKDVPKTPQKGSVSKTAYFCGVTEEMLQKERDQILNASVEDIRALAEIIEAVLAADQICVVGSESKVSEASDILMEVKSLVNC